MAATVAVMLLWRAVAQPTTSVNINAIIPCTINFTFNNATGSTDLSSCTYFLPGANLTTNDWPTCYIQCCPGLVQPMNSTINDIQSCVSEYSSTPFLVTLIGILLGIFLLLVFVCLPCCCSKDGAYFRIKQAILDCMQDNPRESVPSRDHSRDQLKNGEPPGSSYLIGEQPVRVSLSQQIIDQVPAEERICHACGEGKANLKLKCSHYFHSACLRAETKKCQQCHSEMTLPVRAYCGICERRYSTIQRVPANTIFICHTCEEK